ncbi:MAG TPA: redoxin domain-containing protein [Elusimicrobiota bacterium]|jgi:hypothetical protein|nr:redoxin domain-containing protein [Elusimicrobiota bacterium]
MRGLALAAALLLPAPAGAVRPLTPPAPEFPPNAAWLNSQPFTLKGLRGKRVVLVAFINTSTANSLRSLKTLNRWWDQYALKGLLIVGVHAPDFDFDRDPVVVRDSLKRLGVRFPVMVDSGRRLWRAYENEGWPAFYLVDHKGLIVHDRLGEGGAQEFEEELLGALERMNGFRPPASYRVPPDPPRQDCGTATAPMYLGGRRGKPIPEISRDQTNAILFSRDGEIAQSGRWQSDMEALRFAGASNADLSAQFLVVYQAAEAYAVMGRSGPKPVKVFLRQDNLWLHAGNAGPDVRWDSENRSYVLVDVPRLYYVTRDPKADAHELRFFPGARGASFYSLEFSDLCQTAFDHR